MADKEISKEVQSYLDMVESQYSSKPIFMGVLRKYLESVDVATQIAVKIPERFSLSSPSVNDNAYEDAWLDRLGEMVGVSRAYPYSNEFPDLPAVMDNATYKLCLAAKIMANNWDGTYGTFQSKWESTFGQFGVTATCRDNQNMSCTVVVQANLEKEQAALIKSTRLFPKPMGVRFDFVETGRVSEIALTKSGAALAYNYMRVTINVEA